MSFSKHAELGCVSGRSRHVYAYGNSHEDLDMLSLADTSYMVGEDQSLPLLQAVKKLA